MKGIIISILITFGYCFTVFAQFMPNDSIKSYVDFLQQETFLSTKEYILKSFEEKDIIILSERLHPEFKQYEMIVEVIKDKHFTGNVYTEVGFFNMGKKINDFLLKEKLTDTEIKEHIFDIIKNLDYLLWPNYNYYYLIESIYRINQQREPNEKIMLYPTDIIFYWDSIKCGEQAKMLVEMQEPQNDLPPVINRNAIMAQHFIKQYVKDKHYNSNKKKALVIQNTYHGYTRIPKYLPLPTQPNTYSTGEYIYKTFPNSTKGILINGISNSWELVANGKWDAAFNFTGNKNIGFDLKGTPFGKTKFDMYSFGENAYENVTFDFIFDGFVFYEPIYNFEMVDGITGIFDDEVFLKEFYRRALMMGYTKDEIKASVEYWNTKTINKIENFDKYNEIINKWLEK
jgi:hypothetical protein